MGGASDIFKIDEAFVQIPSLVEKMLGSHKRRRNTDCIDTVFRKGARIMDCLFCKIAAGEIPSAKVYEDDRVLVFKDINPVAPVHLLAIPKEHIQSVDAVDASNCELVGYIFTVIAKVAKEQGLTNGYRVVSNIGADGGQSVPHLHFHILGGKELAWPAC